MTNKTEVCSEAESAIRALLGFDFSPNELQTVNAGDLLAVYLAGRAAAPVVERQEPVLIQAVAVTREGDDGIYLEWMLEGGICELEFPGTMLFAMPEANDLCDEDGSAEIYTSPPAPVAVSNDVAQNAKRYEWIRSPNVGHCEISRVLFETISDDCNPPYRALKCGKDLDDAVDACLDKVKEMNQ